MYMHMYHQDDLSAMREVAVLFPETAGRLALRRGELHASVGGAMGEGAMAGGGVCSVWRGDGGREMSCANS